MYVTELEFHKATFDITREELTIWQDKSSLWERTASDYKKQLDLADIAIQNEQTLQLQKDDLYEVGLKESRRKGFRMGTIVTSATAIIICLLVK